MKREVWDNSDAVSFLQTACGEQGPFSSSWPPIQNNRALPLLVSMDCDIKANLPGPKEDAEEALIREEGKKAPDSLAVFFKTTPCM